MFRRLVLALMALVLATSGALFSAAPTRAQLEPEVRDRMTAAVVLISFDGWLGSGTIVSTTGLILTNHHVIADAHRGKFPVEIYTSDGRSAPRLTYFAEVVHSNAILDLAVVQIVADSSGNPIVSDQLRLQYLPLGDSDQLGFGDRLYTLGYPGVGGGVLTFSEGVVSGFKDEPGIESPAWFSTDAVVSGGSSGGATINANGALVGIPTMVLALDCRHDDTNRDGRIDDKDGCIAVGSSVGYSRPVNLAKPMLCELGVCEPEDQVTQTATATVTARPSPTATATPTFTLTPSPTATRSALSTYTPTPSPTPSATPTPTPVQNQQELLLTSLLPDTLTLSPGQSFRLYATGPETLETITANYGNPGMVQQALRSLGWMEAEHRIFAADNVPANATGWTELHIHRFATTLGASDALPLLAWEYQKQTGTRPVDLGVFADESMALAGPAYNGNEVTIIARRGNLIVRATGITPRGDPTSDVIEAILVPLGPIATDVRVVTPELLRMLPRAEHLPPTFTKTEERARSASNTASTFPNPDETSRLFQEWGWLESASGVYLGSTLHGSTRFEALVYCWRDAPGASAAIDYFVENRANALGLTEVPAPAIGNETRAIMGVVDGGTEASIYIRTNNFVLRFTAIGNGDPRADVLAVVSLLNLP